MNKIFAFLCANTIVFTLHGEESLDNSAAARNLDFGSWYNFTQEDEKNEAERRAEKIDEEMEEAEGNTDE